MPGAGRGAVCRTHDPQRRQRRVAHGERRDPRGRWGSMRATADVTIVGQDSPQQRARRGGTAEHGGHDGRAAGDRGAGIRQLSRHRQARPGCAGTQAGRRRGQSTTHCRCCARPKRWDRACGQPRPGRRARPTAPVRTSPFSWRATGVRAEANKTHVEDIEVGELILSRASDFGADLIVMGAYGPFPGCRNGCSAASPGTLLSAMTRPVLISH